MANIDRVVKVSISLQTAAITSQTFSDLLLFGEFVKPAGSTALVYVITDADELIETYGVLVSDPMYLAAQAFFSQIPHPPKLYIGLNANSIAVTDDLVAIKNENNDWYAICDVKHDELKAVEIATWAESAEKLFVTVLSDVANLAPANTDTVSVAALLKAGNFFRTAWWYNADPLEFPDVAICSKSFTKYPGQETWANQRLAGVTAQYMSEGNSINVAAKNGNTFEPFRNIYITQYGKVAGGEWIDVIRFRDWLAEEIKVRIFQQMVDNRIPYTDQGIAIIRSRLQQALDFGVRRGGIAPDEIDDVGKLNPSYTISVPLAALISSNDKANRILRDVYFTARLAGAIHVVEILGTLTYDNLAATVPANVSVSVAA